MTGQLMNLDEVGSKFSHQIDQIFQAYEIEENYLAERIEAASAFFMEKINMLTETLKQSPATTDNRESAQTFNDGIKSLFGSLTQHYYIMKNLQHPFSAENYFTLKNKFTVPEFSINAYSKSKAGKTFNVRHPQLYFKLLELRNKICEPNDTPIYLVASSKTIKEMVDFLPLTDKELLQIHGFGKTKVDKYGKLFLDIITEYCLDNSLTSRMYEKSVDEKSIKRKANSE